VIVEDTHLEFESLFKALLSPHIKFDALLLVLLHTLLQSTFLLRSFLLGLTLRRIGDDPFSLFLRDDCLSLLLFWCCGSYRDVFKINHFPRAAKTFIVFFILLTI